VSYLDLIAIQEIVYVTFVIPFQAVSLSTLPLKMQEIAVIEDLLFMMTVSSSSACLARIEISDSQLYQTFCFQGVEGKYIRLSSSSVEGLDPPEFHVDPTLGM
jgi:hypothetical protein